MKIFVIAIFALAACDDGFQPTFDDFGVYKQIGDPCDPDTPPVSECGYPPRDYCSARGVCASACNDDGDCVRGTCVGATLDGPGECRLPANPDAGS